MTYHNTIKQIQKVKAANSALAFLSNEKRNKVLMSLAEELRKSCDAILIENSKDLAKFHVDNPMYDRLKLNEQRIFLISADIEKIVSLDFPQNKEVFYKELENGLLIKKITVPLGVVSIIYESRPNVTIDVFTLCFKSGNGCVLKGGKEAHYSNLILTQIIQKVLIKYKIDPDIIYLLPPERQVIDIILNAHNLIDVCIPRGSQSLIDYVRQNAKIPIIETGAGIVHIYFDKTGDILKGKKIIENAKTRRVSVCNALDTLIIHQESLKDLFNLVEPLINYNVEIYADSKSYKTLINQYKNSLLYKAKLENFGQEFLSYKLAIKTVSSLEEAIEHISNYTSGHSEAIIAEDQQAISYFLSMVDAAALYVNASTAFTDGGEFGMGGEIGISTQKLHVRGPMGLEALTSYKWIVSGKGHTRV